MLTPEELLIPRYKVIADFPLNSHPMGEIIVDPPDDYYYAGYPMNKSFPLSSMPHIFKKLEWWEDREEKDMPQYVKTTVGIKNALTVAKAKFDHNDSSLYFMYLDDEAIPYNPSVWVPATEDEYNEYKKATA